MRLLLEEWVGKGVHLTLRLGGVATAQTLQGRLTKVDASGVLIEQPKGQMFVPVTSILHIVPQDQTA